MADAEVLASVLSTTEGIIRGVRPDQLDLPTPCPDYTVGTLVAHMVTWSNTFADGAEQLPPNTDRAEYRADDRAGDLFSAASARTVQAFQGGAADRMIDLGNGPSPGEMLFGLMLMEYIGHGWDLAVATDQPTPFSEAGIGAALATGRNMLKPEYRGPDKSFGDIVEVGDEAPALDQLIGFLGRDPAR
ncbi:MAG TPA: TIGR03086 family metal-binding protein [Acidothermaceae bacterium]